MQISYTLGGGSGTTGLYQSSLNGKSPKGSSQSAFFPAAPLGLAVGAYTTPFHCLSVVFGTYSSVNGIYTTADTWDTSSYFGPSLAISPALVIPSAALLKRIANSAIAGDQANAAKAIPYILNAANALGMTDPNQIAAVLAQTQIETNFDLNQLTENNKDPEGAYGVATDPVPPGGTYNQSGNSQPGDGAKYLGRGWIQITGRNNYTNFGTKLNLNLVGQPSLAADPTIAAEIMILGMIDGTFVPASGPLSQYINDATQDFKDVRKMINPKDYSTYTESGTYGTAFAGHTGGC